MGGVRRTTGALAGALIAGAIAVATASSAQGALFPQCPSVDVDTGCQFLVTVTDAGSTVTQDTAQAPYESSDDSLIGVQNNATKAISALPLSAPGTSLFGFESDGLCDPGALPVPSGCVPAPGSPAGTVCTSQSVVCAFPPPPGEPANYTDPGGTEALPWPNGDRQNGYEGPTSWFTAISADTSSGTVNFSPAIQPGGSTYFSLEAPPSAAAIQVGTPTTTGSGTAKLPPAFGPKGAIQGLPGTKQCVSKRHFTIHIRRYRGISYDEVIVFLNKKTVGTVKSRNGQFSAPINLRGLPAGIFVVKITVITSTGSIIAGKRTYHTCHKKLPFSGPPRL
jgi:hypothetical protein